jgi:hypothetical protein
VFSERKNAISDLRTSTSNLTESVSELLDRPTLGDGNEELDWILEMDVDSMSMVEMRRAFRAIVLYIKTGHIDGVDDE